MTSSNRFLILLFSIVGLVGLSACGSDSDPTSAGSEAASDETGSAQEGGEDHDDEGGEDHDDESDEDHEDEGHDAEEVDDDDHADEDHDDGDDDHKDDDHKDDDHEDDDHDDHDDEGSSTGLGAHEHGVAELTVAWSDGDVVIDLISPAYNIFGFEHEPVTDEDLALAADRTEALTAPGVLTINSEAGCSLADEVVTEHVVEGSHSELSASWLLVCENPDEIRQLDASALFAEFPNLEDVDAQRASSSGQSSAELSPSETTFSLQ